MISARTMTDPRTGDVTVQAFTVDQHDTLLTAERRLKYIDVETPDRERVIAGERMRAVQELERLLRANRRD